MKNKIKNILLVFLSTFLTAQIKTEILKIQNPESFVVIRVSNNTDKKLIIYDNFLYSHYNIYKSIENRLIAPYGYANNGELDYSNYQYNFDKELIAETQNKYDLSYENTVYFLENKKTSIIIDPNTQKDITLRVFHKASNPTGEVEKGSYYLTGKIVFTVDYFPKEFTNCLEKHGFTILNEIEIPKTEIDINNFFLKEVKRIPIPKNLEDKFKYNDNGNIIPINK